MNLKADTPVSENFAENVSENKAVITVVGKDAVGIIASVTTHLASRHVNVLTISQTIVDGFFNMMMIVDIADMNVEFDNLVSSLQSLGEEIGVRIHCQRTEIFTSMHRV